MRWITTELLRRSKLNSNGKPEFCYPEIALNILLQCEWRHFAKSNYLLLSMRGSFAILKAKETNWWVYPCFTEKWSHVTEKGVKSFHASIGCFHFRHGVYTRTRCHGNGHDGGRRWSSLHSSSILRTQHVPPTKLPDSIVLVSSHEAYLHDIYWCWIDSSIAYCLPVCCSNEARLCASVITPLASATMRLYLTNQSTTVGFGKKYEAILF
jgi:hypothetical protein